MGYAITLPIEIIRQFRWPASTRVRSSTRGGAKLQQANAGERSALRQQAAGEAPTCY